MTSLIYYITFGFLIFGLSSCRFSETQTPQDIDGGRVFRSGQLDSANLKKLIEEKKIKTVINLRGEFPGEKWYDQEFLLTEVMGVRLISVDLKIAEIPHKRSLIYLLESLRNAEKPILIHCDTGIERTGMVAALYQMIYANKTKADALGMLSKTFGYVDGTSDPSKKYFVDKLWIDETWAIREYDPCQKDYKYYDKTQPECTAGKKIPVKKPKKPKT